jgi:hypothetical protein
MMIVTSSISIALYLNDDSALQNGNTMSQCILPTIITDLLGRIQKEKPGWLPWGLHKTEIKSTDLKLDTCVSKVTIS